MKSSKTLFFFLIIVGLFGTGVYFFYFEKKNESHTTQGQEEKNTPKYDIIVLTNNETGTTNEKINVGENDKYRLHYIAMDRIKPIKEEKNGKEASDKTNQIDWYNQVQHVKDPTDVNIVKERIEKLAKEGYIDLKNIIAMLTPPNDELMHAAAELRRFFNIKGQKPEDLKAFEALQTFTLDNEVPVYVVEAVVRDKQIVFFKVMRVVAHLGWIGKKSFVTYLEIEDQMLSLKLKEKAADCILKNQYSNGGATFYFSETKQNDYVLIGASSKAEHIQQQIWDTEIKAVKDLPNPKSFTAIFEFYLPNINHAEHAGKTKSFLAPLKQINECETLLMPLSEDSYNWKTLYPTCTIEIPNTKSEVGIMEGDCLAWSIKQDNYASLQTIVENVVKELKEKNGPWPIDDEVYYIRNEDNTWEKVERSLFTAIRKAWKGNNIEKNTP